jgi:hypothetical protein
MGHDQEDDVQGLITWEQKSVQYGFSPDNVKTVGQELSLMRYRLCGDGERAAQ